MPSSLPRTISAGLGSNFERLVKLACELFGFQWDPRMIASELAARVAIHSIQKPTGSSDPVEAGTGWKTSSTQKRPPSLRALGKL